MKSKVMIISPLIVIIGLISIVLTHSALNPPQPLAQTTPDELQTTTPIHLQTTIVQTNASHRIYLNNTPPAIPEQFAAEVTTFSKGVQVDVSVNDTTPQIGGAVLVVIRITNVNSSEPVSYGGGLNVMVRNSEGVTVDGFMVKFPMMPKPPHYGELLVNQTFTQVWVWKVETSLDYGEVTPREDYYIDVGAFGIPIKIGPIRLEAES
ncbi:MAG: hypothetical protein ACFFCW_26640 [Candidatus Hodarchaeota archaeon]